MGRYNSLVDSPRQWTRLGRCTTAAVLASLASAATAGPVSIGIPHRQLEERGRILNLNASFSSRAGNGSGFQVGGAILGAATAGGGRHLFLIRTNGDYGEFENTITASNTFAHLRHQYSLLPWWSTDAFVQVQQDRFQRLRSRTLVGGGPAFQLYRSNQVILHTGTGIMHERERYLGSSELDRADTFRSTSYLSFSADLGERATFSLSAYVQPRLADWSDLRVLDEAALTVSVNSWLTTSLGFVIRHDSAPPAGVKKTDVEVRHSLGLTL